MSLDHKCYYGDGGTKYEGYLDAIGSDYGGKGLDALSIMKLSSKTSEKQISPWQKIVNSHLQ